MECVGIAFYAAQPHEARQSGCVHVAEVVPTAGRSSKQKAAICRALDAYVCRLGAAHNARVRKLSVPPAEHRPAWWREASGGDGSAEWCAVEADRSGFFGQGEPGWGRQLDLADCQDARLEYHISDAAVFFARQEAHRLRFPQRGSSAADTLTQAAAAQVATAATALQSAAGQPWKLFSH